MNENFPLFHPSKTSQSLVLNFPPLPLGTCPVSHSPPFPLSSSPHWFLVAIKLFQVNQFLLLTLVGIPFFFLPHFTFPVFQGFPNYVWGHLSLKSFYFLRESRDSWKPQGSPSSQVILAFLSPKCPWLWLSWETPESKVIIMKKLVTLTSKSLDGAQNSLIESALNFPLLSSFHSD